jgi:hypothetical protein
MDAKSSTTFSVTILDRPRWQQYYNFLEYAIDFYEKNIEKTRVFLTVFGNVMGEALERKDGKGKPTNRSLISNIAKGAAEAANVDVTFDPKGVTTKFNLGTAIKSIITAVSTYYDEKEKYNLNQMYFKATSDIDTILSNAISSYITRLGFTIAYTFRYLIPWDDYKAIKHWGKRTATALAEHSDTTSAGDLSRDYLNVLRKSGKGFSWGFERVTIEHHKTSSTLHEIINDANVFVPSSKEDVPEQAKSKNRRDILVVFEKPKWVEREKQRKSEKTPHTTHLTF